MNNYSKEELTQALLSLVKEFLKDSHEISPQVMTLELSLQDHLGIDSIGRPELFRRIERKFSVRLPDKLLAEAESIQDIFDFLVSAETDVKTNYDKKTITSQRVHLKLEQQHSLSEILELYYERAKDQVHIYFQNDDHQEETITYGQLYTNALKVADSLRNMGLFDGETVAIMQPTHPDFFYAFFGVLFAGGIPVPIYPPYRMHQLSSYAKTESRILSNAEVRILITFSAAEKLSFALRPFVPSLMRVTTVPELLKKGRMTSPHHVKSHHPAFIQYTSGSTASPKGVLLTHDNLLTNIRAYGEAIQVTPSDVTISWLPLYHDMGLIGMWLGSLYYGIPLVLMTPFSFLSHPERWLWMIHRYRGTLSGAPNFAYDLCIKKILPEQIEGLDLSSWRIAANGAEKIYPNTLQEFVKKFTPYGFRKRAILPVYGLAESTVALTIPKLGFDYHVDRIDRKKFEIEKIAQPSSQADALPYVACGSPIRGHEIRIVEDGTVLPERHVGQLQFRGPSAFQGYYHQPKATAAVKHDGWVDSGDLAYIAEGNVYITGRKKDLIIKAGRNFYPAEIEEIAMQVKDVRQGCVVAFSVSDAEHQSELLVIVAEVKKNKKPEHDRIVTEIRENIVSALDVTPDKIILVPPHKIPKTSSGKLQRAACKAMFLDGRLMRQDVSTHWQVIKLSMQSFMKRSINACTKFLRLIYTTYVFFLFLLIFFPAFIIILFLERDHAAFVASRAAKWILSCAFCPIVIIGKANLFKQKPVVYASNHASYIDSLVMMAILPIETRIIFKKELMDNVLFRMVMKRLDYLPVNRIDLSQSIEDTKRFIQELERGHPVMIFPEGTFGYSSGLRPFKLGAFKIATETSTSICPIALQGTRQIWRDVEYLMRPGKITVTVSEPISPSGKEWQDVTLLRQQVRTEIAKYCGEPSLDWTIAQPHPKVKK